MERQEDEHEEEEVVRPVEDAEAGTVKGNSGDAYDAAGEHGKAL